MDDSVCGCEGSVIILWSGKIGAFGWLGLVGLGWLVVLYIPVNRLLVVE